MIILLYGLKARLITVGKFQISELCISFFYKVCFLLCDWFFDKCGFFRIRGRQLAPNGTLYVWHILCMPTYVNKVIVMRTAWIQHHVSYYVYTGRTLSYIEQVDYYTAITCTAPNLISAQLWSSVMYSNWWGFSLFVSCCLANMLITIISFVKLLVFLIDLLFLQSEVKMVGFDLWNVMIICDKLLTMLALWAVLYVLRTRRSLCTILYFRSATFL